MASTGKAGGKRKFWFEVVCDRHGKRRGKVNFGTVVVLVPRKITNVKRHPQRCPTCAWEEEQK